MTPKTVNWVESAFPFYDLIRIFHYYLDLECWIISADDWRDWYLIRHHDRESWVIDFDDIYGKKMDRVRFNNAQFELVTKQKKTVCATWNGVQSLFVPILKKEVVIGVLQSGVFLRAIPDRQFLLRQWKSLIGTSQTDFSPYFHSYVRTILETPVVEGPVFTALRELLELYAAVLAGESDQTAVCRRARELRENVFAKHLPHRLWVEKVLKLGRSSTSSWWGLRPGKDMADEMKREAEKMPATVLAIVIDGSPSPKLDDLDLILQNFRFQMEMYKYARDYPAILASPLEDYGMIYFISPESVKGAAQVKLDILDRLDHISKYLSEQLGIKILTGISRLSNQEEKLSRVTQEAVTAVGFCRPLNRPVLFYEDIRTNPTIPAPQNFYDLAKQLIENCVKGEVQDLDHIRTRYVEKILSLSAGRPEVMRLHYFYAFGQIVDTLKKRCPPQSENLKALFEKLEKQMQETGNIVELISMFQDSMNRLLELSLNPSVAGTTLRLDATLKYIDENYNQNLTLAAVAKENGFSVSVFSRGFKKHSGMGFSEYLRKRRIDKSKEYLTTTGLSITQVSQECGFNNLQYFYEVFKKSAGRTPQDYRENPSLRSPNKVR